eukprot:360012_1
MPSMASMNGETIMNDLQHIELFVADGTTQNVSYTYGISGIDINSFMEQLNWINTNNIKTLRLNFGNPQNGFDSNILHTLMTKFLNIEYCWFINVLTKTAIDTNKLKIIWPKLK